MDSKTIDANLINVRIMQSVQTNWFKKVHAHEHGILKLDRCIYPLVQMEPRGYLLPNKDSLVKGTVRNVIENGKLIIGHNSSPVKHFGRKISSLEGEVMQLSAEEIEFIGSMHVNWVNRVIDDKETITVLEVSHNTASRSVVMVDEKECPFARTYLSPVSATITRPCEIKCEGLSNIVFTYFILGLQLQFVDSSAAIAKTVELVDKAITVCKRTDMLQKSILRFIFEV